MTEAEALEVFRRVGITTAVLEMAEILNRDGDAKHGDHGWREKSILHHLDKAHWHASATGKDRDSGKSGTTHSAARCLMVTQLRLDTGR